MKLDYVTGTIVLLALIFIMIIGFNVPATADDVMMIPMTIAILIYISFFVAAFAFWVSMLIDCLQRPSYRFPSRSENDKLIWVLVILFVHIPGAVLYYFLVWKNDPGR